MSQRGPGWLRENCVQTLGSAEGQGEGWYHIQGIDSKTKRESQLVVFFVVVVVVLFVFVFVLFFVRIINSLIVMHLSGQWQTGVHVHVGFE